ncbi:MAG TPA: hypothetical protein VGQ93_10155 [Lysobacter sp.]|nr:hypothetical protein [Lysobacter sp.]
MNNNHHNEFPDTLRWQLRGLRQEVEPARDLWTGIAARLPAQQPTMAARKPHRWLMPAAMAASALLVVGTVGWFARSPDNAATAQGPTLVQREADGMTRQYQAALQEMQAAPMPASLKPTIDELDRDAAMIRAALARDPDSLLLLEQLRRTYAHRLALAQRVAYT